MFHFSFRPSGITHATDEKLNELLNDMKSWKARLPEELQFKGSDTPREGGKSLLQSIPLIIHSHTAHPILRLL